MNWIQKILHIDHKHNPDFVQDFWKISGIITYSDTFFMPKEKISQETWTRSAENYFAGKIIKF